MNLEDIKGIGTKTIETLNKMHIFNILDLVTYYPYKYQILKLSNINENINSSIVVEGIIESIPKVNYVKRNLNRLTFSAIINNLRVNVVIFNRAFMKNNLKVADQITLIGKYNKIKNQFIASDIRLSKIKGVKIEGIYHLINGIKRNSLNKIINNALTTNYYLIDYIPNFLVTNYNFLAKDEAIKILHNPITISDLKKAKLRTIYEELFLFMFKMNYLSYKRKLESKAIKRNVNNKDVEKFINNLPFKLTIDQEKAVMDIFNDLNNEKRMNRLLLGDVGSGKTIISVIAIYINFLSGYQSALMAPTEILATQHYNSIMEIFDNYGIKVRLLVGSINKKEKDNIILQLKNGEIDLIVGTHAIISENIKFKNLGLVITDEQHRFGVNQRKNLQNKGVKTDVLYLSATPIPRTYALTLYGDMDISIIKTKPKGRKEIITKVKKEKEIKDILLHVLESVKNHHQVYVVAPMIEEDEESTLNNVNNLAEKFKLAFHNKVNIGVIHGKIKPQEKDNIMNKFQNNEINILISTTVIEVGIDVKNANMMIIFNAERFGLATLHQLRGRVGRGEDQSYCYLISNYDTKRLKVMEESNDGFYISEKDYEIRGEGDIFGTIQSGDMSFKMANLKKDFKILLQAKKDSAKFIEENIKDNFDKYPQFKNIISEITFIN